MRPFLWEKQNILPTRVASNAILEIIKQKGGTAWYRPF
jgi:hypothetical protein